MASASTQKNSTRDLMASASSLSNVWSLRWTLRSQLDEYQLWPEADDGNEDEVARYEEVMRRVDGEESEMKMKVGREMCEGRVAREETK